MLDQHADYQGHQPAAVHVRQPAKELRGQERAAEQKTQINKPATNAWWWSTLFACATAGR
ncbi:hypothetical protein Hsw_0458 [Hymenobacter swuensis DY53]|uniref:Uncharacterized protein n=1 Tax=Hymenobacter swuensis DY53 TaxID=1227739 RepID=W8EU71_9BACT|nr:hypothetical protein Hsw_0458 [Hymenobacter swuensis DY53]